MNLKALNSDLLNVNTLAFKPTNFQLLCKCMY